MKDRNGAGPHRIGGFSQSVKFEGGPGKYVFFCFVADKGGGPPHVAKGMVSEVTVE